MIKQFLKLMAIAIFFSGIEAVANAQRLTHCYYSVAQLKQLDREAAQLDLVLPSRAEVILKREGDEPQSQSGQLVNIDSKQIQLAVAGQIRSINITDIKQILFKDYAILEGRRVYIRGNDNSDLKSLKEKLSNFIIANPDNGEATLRLTSTSNSEEVVRVNQDNFYIVREMTFESPEIINIRYKVQP